MTVARGEIWLAALDPVRGSEQAGTRPVLVMQTDSINPFHDNRFGNSIYNELTTRRFAVLRAGSGKRRRFVEPIRRAVSPAYVYWTKLE